MTSPLIRLIHVGCRELGIDADTRHDLQLRLVGKASLSDMDEGELTKVLNELKEAGFKPSGGKQARPVASRPAVRFCHVMWRLLSEADAVKTPGPSGLNAFIRARFASAWGSIPIDIDRMQDEGQISDVNEALKAMCKRAGISLAR